MQKGLSLELFFQIRSLPLIVFFSCVCRFPIKQCAQMGTLLSTILCLGISRGFTALGGGRRWDGCLCPCSLSPYQWAETWVDEVGWAQLADRNHMSISNVASICPWHNFSNIHLHPHGALRWPLLTMLHFSGSREFLYHQPCWVQLRLLL